MKVKVLNQCHPSFDGERLARLRALVEGGPAWRALIEHWLPKNTVEPTDVYKERIQLAHYANHAGTLTTTLAAYLFSEVPTVDGVEGDWWSAWLGNVDRAATPWARFWRERFLDALIGRCSYCWVNLPARPEGVEYASAADEASAGALDAYLVRLLPEQVIDWWEDDRGRLTGVMIRDVVQSRPDVESDRLTTWRWTFIDGQVVRRWTWTATKDRSTPLPEDEAIEAPVIQHRMGRLPVVRLDLPLGLWVMGKLEDPVVASLRADNDRTWALHQAAHELLVITSKWGDGRITLGHGHFLRLNRDDSGEDRAAYIAPSGVAFDHMERDATQKREQVYRLVQQLALAADSDASPSKLSGESKAEDWRSTEVVLAAYADLVKDAMLEVLQLVAAVRRERADLSVGGLEGWQHEDLETFLVSAAMATDARELSPTFRKTVAKRQAERLLQDEVSDEDLKAIRKEIDEADVDPAPYTPPPPRTPGQEPPANDQE